jgi:hypothetical protein
MCHSVKQPTRSTGTSDITIVQASHSTICPAPNRPHRVFRHHHQSHIAPSLNSHFLVLVSSCHGLTDHSLVEESYRLTSESPMVPCGTDCELEGSDFRSIRFIHPANGAYRKEGGGTLLTRFLRRTRWRSGRSILYTYIML